MKAIKSITISMLILLAITSCSSVFSGGFTGKIMEDKGGLDDSVSETIISLYMENPIKYIGYVRREDIAFDIKKIEIKKSLARASMRIKRLSWLLVG